MLTIAQILSIISLLTAFNVPPATLARVETVLYATNPSAAPTFDENTEFLPATPTAADESELIDPITINTTKLQARLNPSISGVVNVWTDGLVMQGGMNISNANEITYLVDEVVAGHPYGILGDYNFPFNSKQYANGRHTFVVYADDGAGNTASTTMSVLVNN